MTAVALVFSIFAILAACWVAYRMINNQSSIDWLKRRIADLEYKTAQHEKRLEDVEWKDWPK